MTDYRKIMDLMLSGWSYRDVVAAMGCSHRDVAKVRKAIAAHGVRDANAVSDEMLADWFPDGRRAAAGLYELPDFDGVLAASKSSRHFTLQMAWQR